MYCQQCGKELPTGSLTCSSCGFASAPPPPPHAPPASFDDLVSETKHAAKDLAKATSELSKRLVSKAQTAAKDPSGSAKKVAHRAADELESAAREIDRILQKL
jgi:cell division septum initiation protein DivIVA